ncbi:hypothetical protein RLEG12_24570 [Rhizobium leguminosarum bv. trifolii CB782]|nr:hypothetical protein RLEG12_24570 [Rhizobium leguminosarum bv. trifolii CB782]
MGHKDDVGANIGSRAMPANLLTSSHGFVLIGPLF